MSDDKPSKPNGLGTDPLQRLASLKPSRDLSLGGVKPNKKIFTPNLNVARNKSKGPSSNREQKKEDRNRRDRKNDKTKNFNRNGPNIIKSTGVFSEGLGNSERQFSRISFGREADAGPTMQKPTIRVKDFVKIDKELEDQKIKSVLGEGGSAGYDDEDSCMDFKKVTERDAPIKLPMDDGYLAQKPKPSVKVKQEVVVKTEPEDFEDADTDLKPVPGVKKESCENTDVVNLLRSEEPTLILLQLPDSLPGRGGSRDEGGPRRKGNQIVDEPSTSSATPDATEEKPVDERCRLEDLEEGRIGKLRVHRSGRVTLLLGDTVFEVNMGTKPAFHQEVVSMACDDDSRSANLVSLGPLHHKLSVVPAWETMIQDMTL